MAPSTKKSAEPTTDAAEPEATDAPTPEGDAYVLPVVHTRVPERLVNVGFWGGLTGAVLVGVVDLPLGVLLGAGVVIARHQTKPATEG
jgi:hypothetical protein